VEKAYEKGEQTFNASGKRCACTLACDNPKPIAFADYV
jgi:hypothetical protein